MEGIRKACERIRINRFLPESSDHILAGRLPLDMSEIMLLCFDEPEMVEMILEKQRLLIQYAKAFKEAGANGICMAEPAAGPRLPR